MCKYTNKLIENWKNVLSGVTKMLVKEKTKYESSTKNINMKTYKSHRRSSTHPGGGGGDCSGVYGACGSAYLASSDRYQLLLPSSLKRSRPLKRLRPRLGQVLCTRRRDSGVNHSVVATTSSWPDWHRTVTMDWTTSDRHSPSSPRWFPVSGAATSLNSFRISIHPVATCLVPSMSRLHTPSSV